jgi:hypothetical protein
MPHVMEQDLHAPADHHGPRRLTAVDQRVIIGNIQYRHALDLSQPLRGVTDVAKRTLPFAFVEARSPGSLLSLAKRCAMENNGSEGA